MNLKDIIEGTGRGFWFGYGRFLGVHWGRPSTQDVIEVAADPFYCEEEFSQLVRKPDSRYRSRWQGWSLESKGRVLTDEEKQRIIETLFEKARGYEGVAKRRTFQRLINNRSFAGNERVKDFCVSSVNAGELETELLMENMGSRVLAQVEPSISTPYLKRKFKDKKGDGYERKLFMERVLSGLGIVDFGKDAVYTSEDIVPWIPLVIYAIEEGAINPKYCADRVEEFFAGFPYRSALPHLLKSLESDVCVKGKQIDKTLVATGKKGSGDFSHGSWQGEYEGYREFLYDEYSLTFDSRYPMANGARTSLVGLADREPSLKQDIDRAIQKYEIKSKKTFTETQTVETQDLGSTITHYEREAR